MRFFWQSRSISPLPTSATAKWITKGAARTRVRPEQDPVPGPTPGLCGAIWDQAKATESSHVRFRARCARSSLPSPFASGRSFLPAHNSRVQFRMMARDLRLLRVPLLSTSLFVRVVLPRQCRPHFEFHREKVFTAFTAVLMPFSTSCDSQAHFLRHSCYVNWRHGPTALASVLLCSSKTTSGGHNFKLAQLYGSPLGRKHPSSNAYWYRYTHTLCTAAWFLPFHTRGVSDRSGRWPQPQGAMPVSDMP
jgi:hypothetical protein